MLRLARIAEELSPSTAWAKALTIDDIADALWAQGRRHEALSYWRSVSFDLSELADLRAVRHLGKYAAALIASGDLARGSSLLFEAMTVATQTGDEARIWLCIALAASACTVQPADPMLRGTVLSWAARWVQSKRPLIENGLGLMPELVEILWGCGMEIQLQYLS